jgi:SAM-dependent methyltransferase
VPRPLRFLEQQVRLFRQTSFQDGPLRSMVRILLFPYQIVRKYREAKANNAGFARSDEFDLAHGIETSVRVHPTDLEIANPNWIHASPYFPTPSHLLAEVLDGLDIRFEDFTFVDLGSGKGRVLLMASEFPFRRIVGVELSPELNAIARKNIASYKGSAQKCRDISLVCMDFTAFEFPEDPLFVFLYNPASKDLTEVLAHNLMRSIGKRERAVWVLYVTPHEIFDSERALRKAKAGEASGHPFNLYTNARAA